MNTSSLQDLKIKIFVDGAKREDLIELAQLPYIKGFTTNPNLLRKAGVTDYKGFATDVVTKLEGKPISLEVFADDLENMERQARIITTWGDNVYVKIPVTNTHGESTASLIRKLSDEGMKLNITLICTPSQIEEVTGALNPRTPSIVSVFAGRIADVGIDPLPIMKDAKALMAEKIPASELLWASCRELYNIFEADSIGTHIITVPPEILKKIPGIGKSLEEVSLDGVKAFFDDASAAGFTL